MSIPGGGSCHWQMAVHLAGAQEEAANRAKLLLTWRLVRLMQR